MYRYYNPNPKGLHVGDCTVRAICAVTGLSWYEVHDLLCDLSRDMANMPSANAVWWELLWEFGFNQFQLIDQCPECYTVADFAYDHDKGIYVLGPLEHAVAVISGDWFDIFDSGQTIPKYYFKRG